MNNKFNLLSVETKTVGQTYCPPLRSFTPRYTQNINEDHIYSMLASKNRKDNLEKIPSFISGLSEIPLLDSNYLDTFSKEPKVLLKFTFNVESVNDTNKFHVMIGYCNNIINGEDITEATCFTPTYSFEYIIDRQGETKILNRIDYIFNPKKTNKRFDIITSRPQDVMNNINIISLFDCNTFLYSQSFPLSCNSIVLTSRENINPIAYLKKFYKLAYLDNVHFDQNTVGVFDSNIKSQIIMETIIRSEPAYYKNNLPFSLFEYDNGCFEGVTIGKIKELYSNVFDVLSISKKSPVNYTETTEPFGKNLKIEGLCQELVLNALDAISKANLESLILKGSNIYNDFNSVVSYSFAKGVSANSGFRGVPKRFADLPKQVHQACEQLKNEIFTKLIGLVSKDKINIIFDLNVTSFGVTTLDVQFPSETGVRKNILSFAYPTYSPTSWSPLLTTIEESGALAQRVYEQLRMLDIND